MAVSVPAGACSVAPDYRVPNTLELIKRADAIVVAEVIGAEAGDGGHDPQIVFRPTNRIKGKTLPGDLRLSGVVADGEITVAPSDPYELAAPHPDALTGGCRRYVFEQGSKLILFLDRKGEQFEIATYPFARSLEDLPFPEAPWARAVSMYLRIADLPEARHCEALKKRLQFHRVYSADFRAPIYAKDVERHIADMGNAPRHGAAAQLGGQGLHGNP
jgi:hypothetical protein